MSDIFVSAIDNEDINLIISEESSPITVTIEDPSPVFYVSIVEQGLSGTASWDGIVDKPTEFTPIDHGNQYHTETYITAAALPTKLSDLEEDSNHRTVTVAQQSSWTAKAEVNQIPDQLLDLADDPNHRTVTDVEKATWNGKNNKRVGKLIKTAYTLLSTDTALFCDAEFGVFNITMLPASSNANMEFIAFNINTNPVNFVPYGTDILGMTNSTYVLTEGAAVAFYCFNGAWRIR